MSGGRWDYSGQKIEDALTNIADDAQVKKRWPHLGRLLRKLGHALYSIEHDMDWDLSCDSEIKDDVRFQRKSIELLRAICNKVRLSLTVDDVREGMRVIYVPAHANGYLLHDSCEHGTVSSVNEKFVFVKFDKEVEKFGDEWTTETACYPLDLVRE